MFKQILIIGVSTILFSNAFAGHEDAGDDEKDGIGKEALQELINWECSDENPYKLYLLNCPLESTNKD